jgi:transcriptional regulator with XRE-family HTH domain
MIRVPDPRRIGTILADLRAMNLLSQRALSHEIGMDPARLSDWETGKAMPTLPHLVPALECLGFELALVPTGARPTGTGWPT